MAIRKPLFVVPLDLGTMTASAAYAGFPVTNLNRPEAIGLSWKASGAGIVWARGDLGSAMPIDFGAIIAANAQPGTSWRLRLGQTQAEADVGSIFTPSAFTFSTPFYAAINASTLLTAMSDGITDATDRGNGAGAQIFATPGSGTNFLQMDLGAPAFVQTLRLAGVDINPGGWGVQYLNGATIKVSTDGSSYTTIGTVSGMVNDGVEALFTIAATARYIRIERTGFLAISEMIAYPASGSSYDSGVIPFINPAITRSDGVYHSHMELPSTMNARFWRIDIYDQTGDFQAANLVLGRKIEPSHFYNLDFEYGVEDMGEADVTRFGVIDETPGTILRSISFALEWQSEAEFEGSFRPMMETLGKRRVVYCCFDPEATTYRQARTYMGLFRKPPFATGMRRPRTFSQEFSILSLI